MLSSEPLLSPKLSLLGVTNLQFAKNVLFAKCNRAKHGKMRYACILFPSGRKQNF